MKRNMETERHRHGDRRDTRQETERRRQKCGLGDEGARNMERDTENRGKRNRGAALSRS